jgi:hypothetical protein
MKFSGKFNLPKRSSRLETVPETSVASTSHEPSVNTAVKSMAHVLLGPTGRTPIDNIIHMQHFQLWGFLLVVAGLLYIVWLMQKKLDAIDKQYKEQFVLLHRLFKSHQDLQVEVRKTSARTTPTARLSSVPSVPSVPSVADADEPDAETEAEHRKDFAHAVRGLQIMCVEEVETTLELAEEPELCFDEPSDDADDNDDNEPTEQVVQDFHEPAEEVVEEEQQPYETFE